jgi:2-polyprenyl-3-methyl-5-hydroxy-6-metoxy-1,4-benzoquinol methylase
MIGRLSCLDEVSGACTDEQRCRASYSPRSTKPALGAFGAAPFSYLHRKARIQQPTRAISVCRAVAPRKGSANKSGGGGGFGRRATSNNSKPKPSVNALLKRVKAKYGGTSQDDIARGTQQQIEASMKRLPDHLQLAMNLYQGLQQWNARLSTLSLLQQTQLPPADVEGAKRAQDELQRLYAQHSFSETDVRNFFQQITWDASADAKAAMSITGAMPPSTVQRVERAAALLADACVGDNRGYRCLDVGCGYGVMMPFLVKAGFQPSQIVGIDLSPEMIRNARELHPDGIEFEAVDFVNSSIDACDSERTSYGGIVFCSSLHDMPDMNKALQKAISLLRPNGGKLVILHAQGAAHVDKQRMANPVLVPRSLPTAAELRTMSELAGVPLKLVHEPSPSGSAQDADEGYLAVLQRD